jgi:hypothetical protein
MAGQKTRRGVMTFAHWMAVEFPDWAAESASRIARLAKDFQVDPEYSAMRESFGLEPLLLEAVSTDSLEQQVACLARNTPATYTGSFRAVGLLPRKFPPGRWARSSEIPTQRAPKQGLWPRLIEPLLFIPGSKLSEILRLGIRTSFTSSNGCWQNSLASMMSFWHFGAPKSLSLFRRWVSVGTPFEPGRNQISLLPGGRQSTEILELYISLFFLQGNLSPKV